MGVLVSKFVAVNRNLSRRVQPLLFRRENFYDSLRETLNQILESSKGLVVLEVGGADRPFLKRSPDYEYHGLDVGHGESTAQKYDCFYSQPVEEALPGKYDLVFSVSMLEHIQDNAACFASIYRGLRPGGKTVHYCSCKWHPFSVATRLVGHKWQNILIKYLRPHAITLTGYRTYYDRCTKQEIVELLSRIGYKNVRVQCFFGAYDYFAFFLPLFLLAVVFNNFCKFFGLTRFASGMIVYAER